MEASPPGCASRGRKKSEKKRKKKWKKAETSSRREIKKLVKKLGKLAKRETGKPERHSQEVARL